MTVALASIASYLIVRNQLYNQVDNALQSTITPVARQFFRAAGGFNPDPENGLPGTLNTSGDGFAQLITGTSVQSKFIIGYPGAEVVPPSAAQYSVADNGGYRYDTVSFNNVRYRVLTESVAGTDLAVQLGRPLTQTDHTLSTLGLILWFVTLGGVVVAVGLGYLIGRETLRPVARLTAAAEYVAATQDLSSSIEVQSDDELGRLARSFNSMLDALAASREQQAQLISDAGHELRTPLTSLRTNIELLMRMPDMPAAERSEMFADVEAQLQELTNLIGDLVDLARQDEVQPEPIEVRFDSVVQSAVDRARRRAPAGLDFEVHLTPGMVRAQPALLERAVLNVLDNAVKWSPPGSNVEVWLQRAAAWTLDVRDRGPGIAEADLPHVFDRFYRADTARAMPGSGLGLSIVRQVVANHGGTVSASVPPQGGTVIHMELPIVAEDEASPAEGPEDPAGKREDPAGEGSGTTPSGSGTTAGEREDPAGEGSGTTPSGSGTTTGESGSGTGEPGATAGGSGAVNPYGDAARRPAGSHLPR